MEGRRDRLGLSYYNPSPNSTSARANKSKGEGGRNRLFAGRKKSTLSTEGDQNEGDVEHIGELDLLRQRSRDIKNSRNSSSPRSPVGIEGGLQIEEMEEEEEKTEMFSYLDTAAMARMTTTDTVQFDDQLKPSDSLKDFTNDDGLIDLGGTLPPTAAMTRTTITPAPTSKDQFNDQLEPSDSIKDFMNDHGLIDLGGNLPPSYINNRTNVSSSGPSSSGGARSSSATDLSMDEEFSDNAYRSIADTTGVSLDTGTTGNVDNDSGSGSANKVQFNMQNAREMVIDDSLSNSQSNEEDGERGHGHGNNKNNVTFAVQENDNDDDDDDDDGDNEIEHNNGEEILIETGGSNEDVKSNEAEV